MSELDEIREILAGADYASLPNDYSTVRMARRRMDERYKFFHQVIDTCKRAERAEAERDALRELLKWIRQHAVYEETETARRIDAVLKAEKEAA